MGGRAVGSVSLAESQRDCESQRRAPHRDWLRFARVLRARSEGTSLGVAAEHPDIGYLRPMAAPPHEVVLSRRTIDEIDHQIIELLARRREIVRELFTKKRALGLPLVDPTRESELLEERAAYARSLGFPPEIVEVVFREVLADSHTIDVAG